jgi:transposase
MPSLHEAPARLALSPAEAAEAVGVSIAQVRRWCAQYRSSRGRDGLRHARPARRLILIRPADIERMLTRADGGHA